MNGISMRRSQAIGAPEPGRRSWLSQVDARSEGTPASRPALRHLNWERAAGRGLIADAALPVHPNEPLNTVSQIIICDVGLGTQGPLGVLL
jgi:hypothetical protein